MVESIAKPSFRRLSWWAPNQTISHHRDHRDPETPTPRSAARARSVEQSGKRAEDVQYRCGRLKVRSHVVDHSCHCRTSCLLQWSASNTPADKRRRANLVSARLPSTAGRELLTGNAFNSPFGGGESPLPDPFETPLSLALCFPS